MLGEVERLRELLDRFDKWDCTGDSMRCADGNGCECDLAGKGCPSAYDAMRDFLRSAAFEEMVRDAGRLDWLEKYVVTIKADGRNHMAGPGMLRSLVDTAMSAEGAGNG
jgi:hypothetical protein